MTTNPGGSPGSGVGQPPHPSQHEQRQASDPPDDVSVSAGLNEDDAMAVHVPKRKDVRLVVRLPGIPGLSLLGPIHQRVLISHEIRRHTPAFLWQIDFRVFVHTEFDADLNDTVMRYFLLHATAADMWQVVAEIEFR